MQTQTHKAYRHFTEEEIQRANCVSLIDLARQYGFELENGGRKALHAKKTGGLYIFKDSNRFYHWTADEKGGPIDFVMKYGNVTYPEAVAQLLGVSVKYIRKRQIHSDVNYNKSGSSTPSISQRALLTAILKSSSDMSLA
jgi:DNA primase